MAQYTIERDKAIYEGRYDDARTAALQQAKEQAGIDKEMSDNEKNNQDENMGSLGIWIKQKR